MLRIEVDGEEIKQKHFFICFVKQFALELLIFRYLSATDKGYGGSLYIAAENVH